MENLMALYKTKEYGLDREILHASFYSLQWDITLVFRRNECMGKTIVDMNTAWISEMTCLQPWQAFVFKRGENHKNWQR